MQKTCRSRLAAKWLIAGLVASGVAILSWITIQDISGGDPRSDASGAYAVALCSVHAGQGHRYLIIDEIWKQAASGSQLSVGMSVPIAGPVAKSRPLPSKAVAFFQKSFGHLQRPAVWDAEGERLLYWDIPFSELKALCAAKPRT